MNGLILLRKYAKYICSRTLLLLVTTCFTFLTAGKFSDFVEAVSTERYQEVKIYAFQLILLLAIPVLIKYLDGVFLNCYKMKLSNQMECEVYRRFLQGHGRCEKKN